MSDPGYKYLRREGEYDPLAAVDSPHPQFVAARPAPEAAPFLRVLRLSEILDYEPPAGALLVGDGIIELGEISLLYGPPGSYKGFAVGQLMVCGALGHGTWLGHPVVAQFASLWLNCENGRRRLRNQFRKMALPADAEKYIHITDIPAIWNLGDVRLASEIRKTIVEKNIRLLVIDTVSNFVEDEFAKQFASFFAALNLLLHGLAIKPAVLLIHHSRKPKETDRGARGLLNLISGHQTLQRRARSICYLGRVTEGFQEKRVAAVWLKVSNNGEAEGTKAAFKLAPDATLEQIPDFDWSEWEGSTSGGERHEPKVREEHLREVFDHGRRQMPRNQAADRLKEVAVVGRTTAYEALSLKGRFGHLLSCDLASGLLTLQGASMAGALDASDDRRF